MNSDNLTLDTQYLVCGLKYNPNPELDGNPSMSIEILGAFDSINNAVLTRDIYADLDTTMEAVTITSGVVLNQVPDFDVLLNFTVDDQGVTIRGQCVLSGTEPWLREEEDFFEALVYPEDREEMISIVSSWFHERSGYHPPIIDDISPRAKEFIE